MARNAAWWLTADTHKFPARISSPSGDGGMAVSVLYVGSDFATLMG